MNLRRGRPVIARPALPRLARRGLCLSSRAMAPLSANTAHDLLKQKLEERCTNLTAAFRKVDKSNNGFITPADFSEVMASFGIRVTRPSLMAIVAKYDANGDGFVSYEEFCATMAGKPASKRLATAPRIAAPAATSRAEEVTAARTPARVRVVFVLTRMRILTARSLSGMQSAFALLLHHMHMHMHKLMRCACACMHMWCRPSAGSSSRKRSRSRRPSS